MIWNDTLLLNLHTFFFHVFFLGLHCGCERNPTFVVCRAVDVHEEYAGQLNADFDFSFVDTRRRVSLSASFWNMFDNFSGPVLMYWLLLGVHLQLHGLLLEYLLRDLQILHLLLRDQGHGLMYRGLDDQVGTPIEDANVFKATGKSSTSLELDISQYLFIMNYYLARNASFIQYETIN